MQQRKYDFYIIAAEEDTDWVVKNLLPAVEFWPIANDQTTIHFHGLRFFFPVSVHIVCSHLIVLLLVLPSLLLLLLLLLLRLSNCCDNNDEYMNINLCAINCINMHSYLEAE